jgi:hypothetical protein
MFKHTRALVAVTASVIMGSALLLGAAGTAGAANNSTFCKTIISGYAGESPPSLGLAAVPTPGEVYALNSWVSDHNDIAKWVIENASSGPLKTNLDHVGAAFAVLVSRDTALNKALTSYRAHPTASNKAKLASAKISTDGAIGAAATDLLVASNNAATTCSK